MKQFFTDDQDRLSSMRIQSVLATLTAIGIQVYGLVAKTDVSEALIIWLTAAFVPKAIQKFAETRSVRKS